MVSCHTSPSVGTFTFPDKHQTACCIPSFDTGATRIPVFLSSSRPLDHCPLFVTLFPSVIVTYVMNQTGWFKIRYIFTLFQLTLSRYKNTLLPSSIQLPSVMCGRTGEGGVISMVEMCVRRVCIMLPVSKMVGRCTTNYG